MIALEPLAKTSAVQLDPTLAALETVESSQPNTPRLPSLNDQNIERIRHYVDGEVIFKQGDKGGETFVLLRGKVRVVLTKKKDDTYHTDWKKGKEVATIKKGESFGGMSKINPSHERTATCVAVGNVKLQVIGFTAAVLTDSINAPLVHSNKHQEQHQPDQKAGLNELMEKVTYNDGDFVCRQGEEGHCFFIITSGTVDVRIDGNNEQAEESKQLHPELWSEGGRKVHSMFAGEIFGERAVLSKDPIRSASCVANGVVNILKMNVTEKTLIDNKELRELLGRRKEQLNEQSKQEINNDAQPVDGQEDNEENDEKEDDEDDEEEEILTPRTHAHDYEQHEDMLIKSLDSMLDFRDGNIANKRNMHLQEKEAIYLGKRLHADENAKGRINPVTGQREETNDGVFNGNYDGFVEEELVFSDISEDSDVDLSMDVLVASALEGAQKTHLKKKPNKHKKNNKDRSVASLIAKVTEMEPEQRMCGGWMELSRAATKLLIGAIEDGNLNDMREILQALASKPDKNNQGKKATFSVRTDQLSWSVHENNGPLLNQNSRDKHGLSPTHHAAHLGDLQMLALLVDTWGASLGAMDLGYSVWAHALNSVSKGLGCTQQVLDWLQIRGAQEFHSGKVFEYSEEFRKGFALLAKKKEKAERKALRREARERKRLLKNEKEKGAGVEKEKGMGKGKEKEKEKEKKHHHHHHHKKKHKKRVSHM